MKTSEGGGGLYQIKLVLNKEIAIVLKSGNIREQDILKNGIHSVDHSKTMLFAWIFKGWDYFKCKLEKQC